jgi:signal transduction histidine kinase
LKASEPRSPWSALCGLLANWRDWNIPVKLAAVTLVPVVFAGVLGIMQISDQVDKANAYRRVDRLVVVNEKLRDLVAALQEERGDAGVLLALGAGEVATRLVPDQRVTDHAKEEFLRATGRVTLDHEAGAARYADVLTWLDELTDVREQAAEPGFDAANAVTRYSAVVDALLRFDRTMSAETIDPTLAATASALHDLEEIKEEVSYQEAVIAVGIVRGGGLTGPEVEALGESMNRQADRLSDYYSVTGAARGQFYDDTLSGTGIASRNNVVAAAATRPAGTPVPTTAQSWRDGSALTISRIGEVSRAFATDLRDRSAALQDEASDAAGLAAVILLLALVIALAVMFFVGRHLLTSLARLRRGALDVARNALPDAVARIRDSGEDLADIDLPPVAVTSMDEVGQVARAFDAVQRQALKLATEQAGLRAKYSDMFVNLSRRSQGLVQRQLQLLERLERDEEDPEQLATLFQLDHLATRMRRNNENLMVLSGGEVGRRSQRPTTLTDLLRASVSEIEQYKRVELLPPPSVEAVGYAVGDLVRLVAELLDNATAYSAPDTQVTIASDLLEDGALCVEVLDEGIGMTWDEMDEANDKLADAGLVDVSTSRRMGLFVVGRLAGRHGIEVRLDGGHDAKGVRATVIVPAEMIIQRENPTEPIRIRRTVAETSPLAPFSLSGRSNGGGHLNGRSNGHTAEVIKGTLPQASLPRQERPTPPATEYIQLPHQEQPSSPATEHVRLPRQERPAAATGEHVRLPQQDRPTAPAADDTRLPRRAPGDRVPVQRDPGQWGPVTPPRVAVNPPMERKVQPQPPSQDEETVVGDAWSFADDAGLDGARAASKAEPSDYTSGGLPRRSPRRNLVPGSATPGAATGQQPRHGRDADVVRDRLSDYRSGVRRARDHRPGVESPTPSAAPVVPSQPATSTSLTFDLLDGAWRFAADIGRHAASQVSTSNPVDHTAGGLPRRSPRQNLVPGSVAHSGNGNGFGPARPSSAEELRGRLGNFQKGLSRGRRSLAERGAQERSEGGGPRMSGAHSAHSTSQQETE